MCGRYSVLAADGLQATEVYPTDHAPVILRQGCEAASFECLHWGFKKWDGQGVIINARSETLQTTRMFSGLLATRRCVVPACEYYEWKKIGREKVKYFITDREGQCFFMAGLYRDGEAGREFVIITKDAFGEVAGIHARMPVILREEQMEQWLNGKLSSDDLVKMDLDMTAQPCENENMQMSLF